MMRGLCAEIRPHEAIGTFETECELHLHAIPDQDPIVHAWEARSASPNVPTRPPHIDSLA
jgi:pilus assembly protein CpaF